MSLMLRLEGEIRDFFSGDLLTDSGSLSSSKVDVIRQDRPILGLSSCSPGDFRPPESRVNGDGDTLPLVT